MSRRCGRHHLLWRARGIDLGFALVIRKVNRNRSGGAVGHASKIFDVVHAWCILAAFCIFHILLVTLNSITAAEHTLTEPSALSNLDECFLNTEAPLRQTVLSIALNVTHAQWVGSLPACQSCHPPIDLLGLGTETLLF